MSVTLRKRVNADGTTTLRLDVQHNGQRWYEALSNLKLAKPTTLLIRELLTTSILTPIAGIVPALITTSSKVKEQNLNYPNADLFANKDYQEGYIMRANQRKKRKTWINYAIGSGVSLMVLAAISAGVQASNY